MDWLEGQYKEQKLQNEALRDALSEAERESQWHRREAAHADKNLGRQQRENDVLVDAIRAKRSLARRMPD